MNVIARTAMAQVVEETGLPPHPYKFSRQTFNGSGLF
jgi:hypothetical protein